MQAHKFAVDIFNFEKRIAEITPGQEEATESSGSALLEAATPFTGGKGARGEGSLGPGIKTETC